ncbi:helix-turn-helix domain-containing protein [Streptomyces xanthophaeus]|uniref:helix-turn-helix domain-containing protein n=1 Tax=Streptomyces xanthophaeus TaxID=67385 RepID=UPI0004CD6C2C|nr:helix-turn-helix transcriptional regulator [Streptomyces xanthophaeus]
MSEKSAPDLISTVSDIAALAERAGLSADDLLRVEGEDGLSYASGLPAEDVRALLRGEAVPPDVPGEQADPVEARHRQVVDRILFLRTTRLKSSPDGQRRAHSLAEIAAGVGTSAQWLDKVIRTGRAPNLDHAARIAGFFGESIEFLVAPPDEALERVLQHIRKDLLERVVASQDEDLQRLRNDRRCDHLASGLGVVDYAARALADVPDDTAQPLIALIESVARRAREERDRDLRDA